MSNWTRSCACKYLIQTDNTDRARYVRLRTNNLSDRLDAAWTPRKPLCLACSLRKAWFHVPMRQLLFSKLPAHLWPHELLMHPERFVGRDRLRCNADCRFTIEKTDVL